MSIVRIESSCKPALIFLFHTFDDSMTATWWGAPPGKRSLWGLHRASECGGPRVCYEPDKSTRVNPARFHRIYTLCTPWVNVTRLQCNILDNNIRLVHIKCYFQIKFITMYSPFETLCI